jgi:hypothetical protein
MNLAIRYSSSGQESKGIEYYRAALAVAREVEHARTEALTLANLGNSYRYWVTVLRL